MESSSHPSLSSIHDCTLPNRTTHTSSSQPEIEIDRERERDNSSYLPTIYYPPVLSARRARRGMTDTTLIGNLASFQISSSSTTTQVRSGQGHHGSSITTRYLLYVCMYVCMYVCTLLQMKNQAD
jgi:hypothetical protein